MIISADFHSHTVYSKDSLTRPADLIRSAHQHGLQRLVVTDHNAIAGAVAARQLDPELIIVGEEIKTTHGEILAAYLTEEVPGGLSPSETIRRLREQGAFISVAHPFDSRSGAWALKDLEEIASLVDAVEVFNARCMKPGANQSASRFAQEHGFPGTAGSDAHVPFELGAARLDIPEFNTADELRNVIRQATPRGHLSPFWVHFFSRFARIRKELAV